MAKIVACGALVSWLVAFILLAWTVDLSSARAVSVVLEADKVRHQESIRVLSRVSPIYNGRRLAVEYICNKGQVIVVDVLVRQNRTAQKEVFRKFWKCHDSGTTTTRRVRLKMADEYGFRPGLFVPNYVTSVNFVRLRVFVLDPTRADPRRSDVDAFSVASARQEMVTKLSPPYSRPRKYFPRSCHQWYWRYLTSRPEWNDVQMCDVEDEVLRAVTYPLAMNGLAYGVHRQCQPYSNPRLEAERQALRTRPRFTVSMWVYVLEYCKEQKNQAFSCGLLTRVLWNNTFQTPLLLLNNDGHVVVDMIHPDGTVTSRMVTYIFPRHQWVHLVFTMNYRTWTLYARFGENFNQVQVTPYTYDRDVYYDDTEGLFVIGGTDWMLPSFYGYLGEATLYRRRVLKPEEVPAPSPFHPMFELGVARREQRCQDLLGWLQAEPASFPPTPPPPSTDVCHPPFPLLLLRVREAVARLPQCQPRSSFRPRKQRVIRRILKRVLMGRRDVTTSDVTRVGEQLYAYVIAQIEKDVERLDATLQALLRQAACLGSQDARYTLASLLTNGFRVKADDIQAQAYLMQAAVQKHRLATMALGHRHMFGLGGAPLDKDVSYFYYKYVADMSRDDKEHHKDTDVLTEAVRLSDEATMKMQTDEEGDVFLWLTHQAQRGVVAAQQQVGRALFWGSQGLRRNLGTAMEYFRMGAEQQDPEAMHDYGIVLYRGQAAKTDKAKGLKFIKKAAEKRNPNAINTLGWVALVERNYSSAARHFLEAHALNQPDSGFYLGHMHMNGLFPNASVSPDWDQARHYHSWSAVRGHIDAGVMFAYLNVKGTARTARDLYLASVWARFIAEKNPAVGSVLRKGLHAYRRGEMALALFYYMLAADAGTEVATFNMAWLCEQNYGGITAHVERECQWRNYNLSTQRERHQVDSHALIRMGDYYWFGQGEERDVTKAAAFYAEAALKKDPQAVFSLAQLVEAGMPIPASVWKEARIPHRFQRSINSDTARLLIHLYSVCRESHQSEAFVPCTLALWRVQLRLFWAKYHLWLKISGFLGLVLATLLTAYFLYHHFVLHRLPPTQDTV